MSKLKVFVVPFLLLHFFFFSSFVDLETVEGNDLKAGPSRTV